MLKQVQHDGDESLKGPNISVALQSRCALRRTQALPAAQGCGNIKTRPNGWLAHAAA
jgi:hypothetical protein